MARRPRPRPQPPLDILSVLEWGREILHPVAHYSRVLGQKHGRVRFTQQADIDRLDALIARARDAVLALGRDELFGGGEYAAIVETPAGKAIELHQLPRLETVVDWMLHRELVVVDTETTGLHYRNGDRDVSAAVLTAKMRGIIAYPPGGGKPFIPAADDRVWIKDEHDWEFDPQGRKSTPDALAVHGLSDEVLTENPPFWAEAAEIHALLSRRDVVVVAHNAPFDVGFLEEEFTRCDPALTFEPPRVLDTRALSKRLWPGESASLGPLAARLGVDVSERAQCHSALGDARILARCLPGLLDAVEAEVARMRKEDEERERKSRSRKGR